MSRRRTTPAPAIAARHLVSLGWAVDRQSVHPVESYANYIDVAAQARTVRPLLAFQFERFTLRYHDGSYAVHGGLVTPNYFDLKSSDLGVPRPKLEIRAQSIECDPCEADHVEGPLVQHGQGSP
jgi:hypothetical protein